MSQRLQVDMLVGGTSFQVESNNALRSVIVPRGQQYCTGETTGTIAAALSINSPVFYMRLSPAATARAFIDQIDMRWTTLVAFASPVTGGRRLSVFRGTASGTPTLSGGTQITAASRKSTAYSASGFDVASGGDIRIATTGALTATNVTWETSPLASVSLSHVGALGAYYEGGPSFTVTSGGPIQLEPGQFLAIRNPAAMDAIGTWQLGIEVHWRESDQLL